MREVSASRMEEELKVEEEEREVRVEDGDGSEEEEEDDISSRRTVVGGAAGVRSLRGWTSSSQLIARRAHRLRGIVFL